MSANQRSRVIAMRMALMCAAAGLLLRSDVRSEPRDDAARASSERRGDVTSQPAAPKNSLTLAQRQEGVRDRVGHLEDRLFQLSQALRKTEPEKAQRLMDALGRLRERRLRDRMNEITRRLGQDKLSDAADEQQVVMQDLQTLMKLLMEDPDQLGVRKSEIERLEAIRKQLESLVAEQERELHAAEEARAAMEQARALEAAAERVSQLLSRQRKAAEQAEPSRPENSEAAESEQKAIREETQGVIKDLQHIAESVAPASEASELLEQASDRMKDAEKGLRDSKRDETLTAQQQAAESLERARKRLEQGAKSIRKTLKLDEQSDDQRLTAEKTKKLGDSMRDADREPESEGKPEGGSKEGDAAKPKGDKGSTDKKSDGKQEGGAQGESGEESTDGPSPNQDEPPPGQKNVQDAVPYQEDAADELKKESPDKAVKKQKNAVENLKKAKEELEDRLDQLRKEQQEEFLAALESRFRAMLSRQIECNQVTARLAEVGATNWKRSDQLEVAELSNKQRWVGDQADEALFLLKEEGTTVILPHLVEQVRDDGREIGDRIAAADVGDAVRVTQADMEEILRDIIGAIERKQEEMEENEGGGESSDGNSPLLPGSAELKLLRSCQLRVNRSTEQLQADRLKPDASPEEVAKRLSKLSERQADVAEMAKQMHEALRQAQ